MFRNVILTFKLRFMSSNVRHINFISVYITIYSANLVFMGYRVSQHYIIEQNSKSSHK